MDRPRLEGGVPLDPDSGRDLALAALTRRVAELEHRLDVMKIVVGLVLAAKVLLVAFVVYLLVGGFGVRGGNPGRQTMRAVELGSAAVPRPPAILGAPARA